MKTLNNELVVHQGETFTISRTILNRDNTPYVISKEIEHPFFLLTVASTAYDQKDRYVKQYWLDASVYGQFKYTKILDIRDLKTASGGQAYPNGIVFGSMAKPGSKPGQYIVLEGYYNGSTSPVAIYSDDFVVRNIDGEYYYFALNSTGWTKYVPVKIVHTFMSKDTHQWTGQSYVYNISLVGGVLDENGHSLTTIHTNKVILPPTKLSVVGEIKGGNYGK